MQVNVCSFSFVKGLPPMDLEEGGCIYVFDCRVLPDPWFDPALAGRTGLDAEVARFFTERREEVDGLLDPVIDILDVAIKADDVVNLYFGCTGGHHRSVYCAHRIAEIVRRARKDVMVVERHLNLRRYGLPSAEK